MKKVILTVTRGGIARNLLQNDFYEVLTRSFDVVIMSTAAKDPHFIEMFERHNVRFLEIQEQDHTWSDRLLFFFHKNLIYNQTVDQKNHWGPIGTKNSIKPSYISYLTKKIIFIPISRLIFLRDLVRLLDDLFLQKSEVAQYHEVLLKEKPDLIVSTNISADTEAALIKAARRLKIRTVGMPKSWDNTSKHGFRVKTDVFVVWNEFMKEQAIRLQNYRLDQVAVIGIPQFDYYVDKSRIWSREKFCELYGLDPARKIIMFGSEGGKFPTDGDIAAIIAEQIHQGRFHRPCQLLVRPHYGYKNDDLKFKSVFGKALVSVDRFNKPSANFRDEWDYSRDFMDRFLNTLYHSDIAISTCSTLALDAVAFDKPLISIGFDGDDDQPYERSLRRWYETQYYSAVIKTGAIEVASSREKLASLIDQYLNHPEFKSKEREILRQKFVYPFDGQAGRRLADLVIANLERGR